MNSVTKIENYCSQLVPICLRNLLVEMKNEEEKMLKQISRRVSASMELLIDIFSIIYTCAKRNQVRYWSFLIYILKGRLSWDCVSTWWWCKLFFESAWQVEEAIQDTLKLLFTLADENKREEKKNLLSSLCTCILTPHKEYFFFNSIHTSFERWTYTTSCFGTFQCEPPCQSCAKYLREFFKRPESWKKSCCHMQVSYMSWYCWRHFLCMQTHFCITARFCRYKINVNYDVPLYFLLSLFAGMVCYANCLFFFGWKSDTQWSVGFWQGF